MQYIGRFRDFCLFSKMQLNYLTGVQVSSGTHKRVTHSKAHMLIIIAPFYRFYFPTHSPKPSFLLERRQVWHLHCIRTEIDKSAQMQLNLLKALGPYFGSEKQRSPIFKHSLTLNQNQCF